jgi:hypothetical protein
LTSVEAEEQKCKSFLSKTLTRKSISCEFNFDRYIKYMLCDITAFWERAVKIKNKRTRQKQPFLIHKVDVRLSQEELMLLEQGASTLGLSRSFIVRIALGEFFKRQGQQDLTNA